MSAISVLRQKYRDNLVYRRENDPAKAELFIEACMGLMEMAPGEMRHEGAWIQENSELILRQQEKAEAWKSEFHPTARNRDLKRALFTKTGFG